MVSPDAPGLPLTVGVVEELGSDAYLYGHSTVAGMPEQIIARIDPCLGLSGAQTVRVDVHRDAVHVFDKATGDRLSTSARPVCDGRGRQESLESNT